MTKDHLKPLNKGGALSRDNVIPCCKSCNSSKRDNEWLSWFQKQEFYSAERAKKIRDYIDFIIDIADMFDERASKLVVTKEVVKEVQPDTTAQIFWLKNRKPATWRDKVEAHDTTAIERLDNILAHMKATAIKEVGGNSD